MTERASWGRAERGPSALAFRRKWVVSVATPLTDLTILAMDQQFAVLLLRNRPRGVDGLTLGIVDRRHSVVAFATHRPAFGVRYYVLVLARHPFTSFRLPNQGGPDDLRLADFDCQPANCALHIGLSN